MSWRRVPPVHSPIAASTLLAGAVAALRPRTENAAERALLERAFDARATVFTDSGTSALVLALRLAAPGGVVAMPGYACIDVIAAAARAGVRAVLYDVDPHTLSPDIASLAAALDSGAGAVVVASLFGYPPDMPGIAELVAARGAVLVEDAAQAAGGSLAGRRVGAFGDLTVVSFGRGKGTTGGSGGALLVRAPRFVAAAERMSAGLRRASRGITDVAALAAQWALARPTLYSVPASIPWLRLGEMVYHPAPEPGQLSRAAAPVLRSALALDEDERACRRRHAVTLAAAAQQSPSFGAITPLALAQPGYLRFAVVHRSGTAATAQASLGVLRGYPMSLDEHPETRRILARPAGSLAGARTLRDALLTLPTHSRMSAADVARLERWLAC